MVHRSRGQLTVERRQPLKVEVPSAKDESVRFGRVGLIVTIGFGVGVLWPRLAGVKLVPSAPVQAAEASSADLSGAPLDPKSQPAAAASAAPVERAAEEPPAAAERLVVSEPQVVACRSGGKKKKDDCDQVPFDTLARPHIQALSSCPGSEHASGVLSLGFELDFESASVKSIKNGKSTSLPQDDVDRLLGCAKKEFTSVSLTAMAHKNDAYTVFYRVEFPESDKPKAAQPAVGPTEAAPGEVTEATGRATVSWDVALVRATANRDGAVVARVMQGTRVTVTGRRGDWYRVKYDAKGSTGWVYRTAIGM